MCQHVSLQHSWLISKTPFPASHVHLQFGAFVFTRRGQTMTANVPLLYQESEQIPANLDGGGGAAYRWFTSALSVLSLINVGLT